MTQSKKLTGGTADADEREGVLMALESAATESFTTKSSNQIASSASMTSEDSERAKDTIEGNGKGNLTAQRLAHKLAQQLCVTVSERQSPPLSSYNNSSNNGFATRRNSSSPCTPDRSKSCGSEETSPSTSQVSVGSIAPNLTASLMRHYDLTPVMRNTSIAETSDAFAEAAAVNGSPPPPPSPPKPGHKECNDESVMISPHYDDHLFGEGLLLPPRVVSHHLNNFGGPVLPPLSISKQASRRQSSIVDAALTGTTDKCKVVLSFPTMDARPELTEMPPAVPLRKFYTFTDRQQYEQQQQQHMQDEYLVCLKGEPGIPAGLKPYQPSREQVLGDEDGDLCLGGPDPANLEQIFLPRTRTGNGLGESHANHRLLQNPIPLDDRQWSIPSIRMANQLQQSSTCGSLTSLCDTETDDESLILRDGDDHSFSSRGSGLYFPDTVMDDDCDALLDITASISDREAVAVENDENGTDMERALLWRTRKNTTLNHQPFENGSNPNGDILTREHPAQSPIVHLRDNKKSFQRKRKQQKRNQGAYEWLQSVEADSNVLAEAASSKFLTGRQQASLIPSTVIATQAAGLMVEPSYFVSRLAHTGISTNELHFTTNPVSQVDPQQSDDDKDDDNTNTIEEDDDEEKPITLLQRQASSPANWD